MRCLEEENESLEAQIIEMEERLAARPIAFSSISPDCPSYSGLEAVIERLHREKVFKHASTRHTKYLSFTHQFMCTVLGHRANNTTCIILSVQVHHIQILAASVAFWKYFSNHDTEICTHVHH